MPLMGAPGFSFGAPMVSPHSKKCSGATNLHAGVNYTDHCESHIHESLVCSLDSYCNFVMIQFVLYVIEQCVVYWKKYKF